MITQHNLIVTLIIIIPIIERLPWFTLNFLCGIDRAQKVNHIIIQNFSLFVVSHLSRLRIRFQTLANREWKLWNLLLDSNDGCGDLWRFWLHL